MRYLVAIEEHGPSWDAARPMSEQDKWAEHAAFMNALVEEGFVVLGGPLGDGARVMLVVNVGRAQELERRLADDPWIRMGLLSVVSIEPWKILLGD
jgi:uncharacterized protein YciI